MSFWWDIESDFKPKHFKNWLLWEAHHQHNQAKTLTVQANSPFDHLIEVNKTQWTLQINIKPTAWRGH